MSLFGPSRPKGITKEELIFIRGELGNASFGHGAEKLSKVQIDEIMEDLNLAMDPDTAVEIAHKWEQVSAEEAKQIEDNAANSRGIKYSKAQLDHIKQVFDKYLAIDKHKSFL